MEMLENGATAVIKIPNKYAQPYIANLVGTEVRIQSFVNWSLNCDSRVYTGLSHYHVEEVHAAWSSSANMLVVPGYCIPAAYLERTRHDCRTHTETTDATYTATVSGTSAVRPGDGHNDNRQGAWYSQGSRNVVRRFVQGWKMLLRLR